MPELKLPAIRRLRLDANTLLSHQPEDLAAFLNAVDGLTFRRLPNKPSPRRKISVATSCSCLMSLTLSKHFSRVYRDNPRQSAKRAFEKIYHANW